MEEKCSGVCESYYVGEFTWLDKDRPDLLEAHSSYLVNTKFFSVSHSRYDHLSVIYLIMGLESPTHFVLG